MDLSGLDSVITVRANLMRMPCVIASQTLLTDLPLALDAPGIAHLVPPSAPVLTDPATQRPRLNPPHQLRKPPNTGTETDQQPHPEADQERDPEVAHAASPPPNPSP